jgi:anti-sigma factor RsiW
MDINRNNYENFFLLYLDRELNEADRNTVEKFLNENTDLQREFALLQKTIQWPADILFEQKESLYRKEEKRRIIPVYWMRRAAAIALILAGSWFMMTRIVKNPGKEIAGAGNSVSTGCRKD